MDAAPPSTSPVPPPRPSPRGVVPPGDDTAANGNDAAARGRRRRRHHRQADADADAELGNSEISALSAGAIERAFGNNNNDNNNNDQNECGSIVMPTAKCGSDAASMYSMSQSILPADPRDRLYYQPRRHLLQCSVKCKRDQNFLKALFLDRLKTLHFHMQHTKEFVIGARVISQKSHRHIPGDVDDDNQDDDEDDVSNRGGNTAPTTKKKSYVLTAGMSNVVFSINAKDLDRDGRSFVGKLSLRAYGNEAVLFSEGSKEHRKELAAVVFEPYVDNQRRFKVVIPAIDAESGCIQPLEGGTLQWGGVMAGTSSAGPFGEPRILPLSDSDADDNADDLLNVSPPPPPPTTSTPIIREGDKSAAGTASGIFSPKVRRHCSLAAEYRRDPTSPRIIVLENVQPQWDSALRGYQLDFHGRATMASEKNFKLIRVGQPSRVVMLFGRQSKDEFAVDFRFPLCGLQAAAIATSIILAKKL